MAPPVLAPAGPQNVATGGAQPVLRQAQPVVARPHPQNRPGRGGRGVATRSPSANHASPAPPGTVRVLGSLSTGCARRSTGVAPPVATFCSPLRGDFSEIVFSINFCIPTSPHPPPPPPPPPRHRLSPAHTC